MLGDKVIPVVIDLDAPRRQWNILRKAPPPPGYLEIEFKKNGPTKGAFDGGGEEVSAMWTWEVQEIRDAGIVKRIRGGEYKHPLLASMVAWSFARYLEWKTEGRYTHRGYYIGVRWSVYPSGLFQQYAGAQKGPK